MYLARITPTRVRADAAGLNYYTAKRREEAGTPLDLPVTKTNQRWSRHNNIRVTYRDRAIILAQYCAIRSIPTQSVRNALYRGEAPDVAITRLRLRAARTRLRLRAIKRAARA